MCTFCTPEVIVCDQASIFMSKTFDQLATLLKVKIQPVSKENHGANPTERYIQSMNNIFRKYLEDQGKDWPDYVQPAAYAMNSFVNPVTGFSPYEMVFGQKPEVMGKLNFQVLPAFKNEQEYVSAIKHRLKMISKMVLDEKAQRQELQLIHEQRKNSEYAEITAGDLVLLKRPDCTDLNPAWKKLRREWVGPLRVLAPVSTDKFLLTDWTGRIAPVLAQRRELKPYFARMMGTNKQEILQAIRDSAVVIQLLSQEQNRIRNDTMKMYK